MLSGVGPADCLRSLGIGVVADLPGVGGNLRDHPDVCVQCQSLKPELSLARYQRLGPALSLGLDYVLRRKGPGASPFWGAIAFAPGPSSDERPDYQVFLTPMVLIENPGDAVDRTPREPWYDTGRIGRALFMRGKHAMAGLQLDVNLMRPESRGAVRLASADPMAPPLIDPNYLGEAADRTAPCRRGRAGARHPRTAGFRRHEGRGARAGAGCARRRKLARLCPRDRHDRPSPGGDLRDGPPTATPGPWWDPI